MEENQFGKSFTNLLREISESNVWQMESPADRRLCQRTEAASRFFRLAAKAMTVDGIVEADHVVDFCLAGALEALDTMHGADRKQSKRELQIHLNEFLQRLN